MGRICSSEREERQAQNVGGEDAWNLPHQISPGETGRRYFKKQFQGRQLKGGRNDPGSCLVTGF